MVFTWESRRGTEDPLQAIVDHIICAVGPEEGDTILVQDPYLQCEAVHRAMDPGTTPRLESAWALLLAELAHFVRSGEIRILTSKGPFGRLSNWPDEVTVANRSNPVSIAFDTGTGTATRLLFAHYPNPKGNDRPALHDRFLIRSEVQSRGRPAAGVHIGPSLDDIRDKDVTITLFTEIGAQEAALRHAYFFNLAGDLRR